MRNLFSARCWILVFLSFYVTVAHAQDNIPTHPVDGTFIKEWLVLGPFFPEDLETDFLASVNGETSANPRPGDTVTTAEGKTLTWTVYRSEGDRINLHHAVGNHQEVVCYAFCLLESDKDGDGEILVGSDDGVTVFFNGQRVHNQQVRRAIVVDEDKIPVSLRSGKNRCLMKVSNGLQDWELTTRVLPSTRAVITGVITNETGNALSNATVNLWQGDNLIAKTETDTKGSYQFSVYPANGSYDVEASHGDKGKWTGVPLSAGTRVNMNLTLQKVVSISGALLKFDDTPHVGVLVEALLLGKNGSRQSRATTLSDNRGQYKFINLRTGRYQLRCQALKTQGEYPNKIVSVVTQNTLKNVDFRFPPFKYGTWKHYTYLDGLGNNHVRPIYQDREGFLWFGTNNGGISRYDGEKFVNFTTSDGLTDNSVWAIHQDRDGFHWFGTLGNGISRYDGKAFINFTTNDGLADNSVWAIHQDRDGLLWFGTRGGVSRYDGKEFVNFTTKDGLIANSVFAIYQDQGGHLWFGTYSGVSRYDGEAFVNFTTADGLANDFVWVIHQDQRGHLWFGTNGGISRYDGEEFVNFTTDDGLVSDLVRTIHQDQDDVLWFGTWNSGISRYDGKEFINFTTDDGLADNSVWNVIQDRAGAFWFSSPGKGLSQYDSSGFINLTAADGMVSNVVYTVYQDREGLIWFGTEGGISKYDGDKFINFTTDDGLVANSVWAIHQDRDGYLWFGTDAGVSRYDGEKFVNFTTDDGLAFNQVWAIHQDRDGYLWFGTSDNGISRYDGKEFVNFIPWGMGRKGVTSIYQDREGSLWFGISDGGIYQYRGNEFVNFTTDDGLASNSVWVIHQDRDGYLWFGTDAGVSRYDGEKFVNFTTDDGLAFNQVWAIHQDRDGYLWFGTRGGAGVSRYDGEKFVNFTTNDGLAENDVASIYQDREGSLWFGISDGGIYQYRGNEFVNFTTDDGLASNSVWVIHQDRDGYLWFGTRGGAGVSRYDGEKFVNFTTNDGLAENDVASIYQDREGSLWFGTHSGGVSQYDGTSWTSLDTRDGLINNHVLGISQDSDGKFWFGTLEGVTQYNPNRVPPRVRIVSVQSHNTSVQTGSLETIKDITTDTRVTIKYSSIDFKTVKEKRQYRVRIKEIDSDWRKPTRSDTLNTSFDKPGTYTFEVVAIDRDLNYSAPASLTLTVVLPWYQNGWILYPSGGAIVVLLLFCGVLAYRYYHQRQEVLAYQQEAVSELADAREMQMGLIPQAAPEVPGFEIAGICISARTVSGDFFDYVPLSNGTLAVVLADVTGKGMKGAMNAVLSSGALYTVAQLELSPSQMLWALNQNLYPRFQRYTNCAMGILTIDPTDKTFRYANAGIPYPIIKRGEDDIEELSIDGMPLGAFRSSEYEETPAIELKSGNTIILFSDGITEASQRDNSDQLYMETDRLTHLIKGLDKTMTAEAVIDAIINDVRDFSGGTQQSDDITIVVIKAL
jgi:ligand-binding sensor domain-containing protein/serine phosphatase RsbU (regulator of sigma subunit)